MLNEFGRGAFVGLPVVLADSLPDEFGNTLIMAFVHVFAMMVPWLVFGFLMARSSVLSASAGHSLSAVHWASAVFLAAMMAYNLIRPVAHA